MKRWIAAGLLAYLAWIAVDKAAVVMAFVAGACVGALGMWLVA